MTSTGSYPNDAVTHSPIHAYLADLHARHAPNSSGKVADYIPELAHANPDWFGICIATRDGIVYEVGDTQQPFTIQSASKPLTYGLALADCGEDAVLRKIGVEPSGDAFNAISLQPQTGAPLNPLINAGAIAACGLVHGESADARLQRILETFGRYAGRALDVDERVYGSESATGHRNRAIGWMLRSFGIVSEEPTATLETYFRQCAIRVTCRDLAIMGATLANGGANPVTGERAIDAAYVDNVLSVMATCGMYDFSGEWLYRTGLPAKSGVGGGILAVQPAGLGIGVFSPRLDAHGNSVRGIAVCRELAADLGLHIFDVSARPAPVIRMATTRRSVASSRRRPQEVADYLRGVGNRLRVYHAQGALVFASVEPLIRDIMARADSADSFVLNLKSVESLDGAAARLLARVHGTLESLGRSLLFTEASTWWESLTAAGVPPAAFFADDDFALEYGENALLGKRFPGRSWDAPATLAECALFAGFDAEALAILDRMLEHRDYGPGQTMIAAGQSSDELFVILRGNAMVSIPTRNGITRLAAFAPGMSFGEIAFIDRSPRTADVTAIDGVACRVLTHGMLSRLEREAPLLKIRLLENVARGMTALIRQADAELAALR
ncbi:MAG TPA: glutaminase A [Casimicrobiaceae bacterium]|nr:glutaminase A [Casimicrobiaceae bacterium]